MAWRFVRQPNGLFAIFSEVVDDFTVYDMTPDEMAEYLIEYRRDAPGCEKWTDEDIAAKVGRAIVSSGLERWDECIRVIRDVHGEDKAAGRVDEIGRKRTD